MHPLLYFIPSFSSAEKTISVMQIYIIREWKILDEMGTNFICFKATYYAAPAIVLENFRGWRSHLCVRVSVEQTVIFGQ